VHVLAHSMGVQVLLSHLDEIAPALLRPHSASAGGEEGGSYSPPGSASGGRQLRLASVTLVNPEVSEDIFLEHCLPRLRVLCPLVTIYGDEEDGALFWSEVVNRFRVLGKLHSAPYRAECRSAPQPAPVRGAASLAAEGTNERGEWADIDVVDMTWLESNVHSLRHNSFNLNRTLVDDLRELIVEGKRAAQRRSRLVCRKGNVYTFLQPPLHVVND